MIYVVKEEQKSLYMRLFPPVIGVGSQRRGGGAEDPSARRPSYGGIMLSREQKLVFSAMSANSYKSHDSV